MRCLVHLIRSTKFLDRQRVRRSSKVSGGMLKTNYESNACLLLETDLRWLLWGLGLLLRALKSGLWPVMRIAKEIAMVSGFFVEGRRQTLLYSYK